MSEKFFCPILTSLLVVFALVSLATGQDNERRAILEAAKKEAEVDWLPLQPVFVQVNTIMLAARSRHANAAKLFIDFALSKKGQEMIRSFHHVPSRLP